MQIINTFNTTKPKVLHKEYNIFIPICLGNKVFIQKGKLTKHVSEYISFALNHTKEKVLLVVADSIQDTNYMVRKRYSPQKSRTAVLENGIQIKQMLLDLIQSDFSHEKHIHVISYAEYVEQDPNNHMVSMMVYKEYKNNPEFAHAVVETVKTTQKDRVFTDSEYIKLADYILDEFSIVYSGVMYEDTYYGLFLYPEEDSTVYFIENIQLGNMFKDLSDILPIQKTGVVILNTVPRNDAQAYYDELSPTYESLINDTNLSVRTHDEVVKVFKKFDIQSGSILDIGCGPGNLKKILKKRIPTKFSFTGIDISSEMLKLAKQGSGYACIHGYAEDILPLIPDKSYDYVVAISSLHFVRDIKTTLMHIARITRKGFLISLDQMTSEYAKGFKTVCDTVVYDHFDIPIDGVVEDYSFPGWISPRENKEVQVRLVYKKV